MRAASWPMERRTKSRQTTMSPASSSARPCRHDGMRITNVLLEVDNINTFRGPAHILRNVSIDVAADEVVALVGRNGAGRTTLIESITGLLPIRSGRITFDGAEIGKLPPHQRAKHGIGYAPENSGIFPELTVAENLMISRWLADKKARGAGAGGTTAKVDAHEQALTVFPEV